MSIYDLPGCQHASYPVNLRVTTFSTADPEPKARREFTVVCLVCGKIARTVYRRGVRVPLTYEIDRGYL